MILIKQRRLRLFASIFLLFFFFGCAAFLDLEHDKNSSERDRKAKTVYGEAKTYNVTISKEKQLSETSGTGSANEIKPVIESGKQRKIHDLSFSSSSENIIKDGKQQGDGPPEEKKGEGFFMEGQVELKDLLDTIIVEFLEGSYVIGANPAQKVSIHIQGKFTEEDMLAILKVTLESMNLTLARHRGVYHIISARSGTVLAENIRVMVIAPRYVRAVNLIPILKDLKSKGGKLATIQGTNIIYMFDYPGNLERSKALISVFDVPFFKDRYVRIYSLKSALSQDVAGELNTLMKEYGLFAKKEPPNVSVISLERINKVIVMATSQETIDYLDTWIDILDQEKDLDDELGFFTYRPNYSLAKDLVSLLNKVFPKLKKDDEGLEAYSDEISNLLVMRAKRSIYHQAREIISRVDRQPRQVYIQAVLAEIKLDENMQMGFQWWAQHNFKGLSEIAIGSVMGDLTGTAFTLSTTASDFYGVLNQKITDNEAKVIATPHILVQHGEDASIEIKREVPVVKDFLKTDQQVDGTTSDKPSIEYKDAGIILKVNARIISSKELEIKIEQEVSEPRTITVAGIETFEFNTRKVTTKLMLMDQQTILIGGLISKYNESEDIRVPILGSIPIIKYMFMNKITKNSRIELVLFLTPIIINNSEELASFTDKVTALFSNIDQKDPNDAEDR